MVEEIKKSITKGNTGVGSFSRRLVYFTIMVALLDVFTGGKLFALLSLQPSAVLEKMEFWRLATYPFVNETTESILFFFISFFLFAPKIERDLNKLIFPLLILLLICLQGTIFTLAYWKTSLTFSGMDGVSFFILVLFTLLNIRKKISIFNSRPVNALTIISLIIITYCSSIYIHSLIEGNTLLLLKVMSSLLFGVTAGMLSFLQIFLARRIIYNSQLSELEMPKPEELTPALISHTQLREFNKLNEEISQYQTEGPMNEERLNEILDKILEHGKESLSPEEIKFLENYSNNL